MDEDVGDRLTVELPGGGSLGFAGFGDLGGVPCLAVHGSGSSRLMPRWMFAPEPLTEAGVRMIGVDRPGYIGDAITASPGPPGLGPHVPNTCRNRLDA